MVPATKEKVDGDGMTNPSLSGRGSALKKRTKTPKLNLQKG